MKSQKKSVVSDVQQQSDKDTSNRTKVFVGLSGGVDSSVAAALLVEQGYDVTGVYMKNWSKDLPGFPCPWEEDYQDAKRVAVKLGIKFELFDFESAYFEKVVKYMIEGYEQGITPNPDVMCNQEIKFKLFYDVARERGADFIATGHYARIKPAVSAKGPSSSKNELQYTPVKGEPNSARGRTLSRNDTILEVSLQRAVDENKDQTYFLYRVSQEALQHTLFPLGELTKPQVREEAKKRGLITADKKESMGICFVGKVGIREFLSQYVKTKSGPIIDQNGVQIGEHDGAIFYTIGQRHGLQVGGGLPYYVTGKDMKTNTVMVTSDISDSKLWTETLQLTSCHWIEDEARVKQLFTAGESLHVRTRHRAQLASCTIESIQDQHITLKLHDAARAITAGQSAVLYAGDICLGGGILI